MDFSDLLHQFQMETASSSLEKIAKNFENISKELGELKARLQEHIDSDNTNQNTNPES